MAETVTLENALWESTKESFDTMIMLPMERVEQAECTFEAEKCTVGSITFTGAIQGIVVLKCTSKGSELIARSMLMMPEEESVETVEIHDAFGKVVNLAIGGFKTRIADDIGNINISVPMVTEGVDILPAVGSNCLKAKTYAKGENYKLEIACIYRDTS